MGQPGPGGVLVKVLQLSLDPAMRGWMNEGKSYIPPVGIGEVMRAGGAGKIIASNNAAFAVGDYVAGGFGVQEYCTVPENGLKNVGLAKIKGCRVAGIAGGPDKCKFVVEELGFDACIDYKAAASKNPVRDGLKQHCPQGVDVYFDNAGGEILDAVLTRINRRARIVICGAISQYNNTTPVKGPSNYLSLLVNRARMEGIVVFDWADRYGEGIKQISQWMKEGKFISREDLVDGLNTFPETLNMLFEGKNFGKLVLKVADE